MVCKSINIIWRKTNYYSNIDELLNNVQCDEQMNVYNLTDGVIAESDKYCIVVTENRDVNSVVKEILGKYKEDKSYNNEVYIIDACINYDAVINCDTNKTKDVYWVQVNMNKHSLYIPVFYRVLAGTIDNIDMLCDIHIDQEQILIQGSLDEMYLEDYCDTDVESSRNIRLLIIEYLLDTYLVNINNIRPKNTIEIHYLNLIAYLKNKDLGYLLKSFKVTEITYEALYYLIDAVSDANKVLIDETVLSNLHKIPTRGVFRVRDLNTSQIEDYIIKLLIDKKGPRFKIENIPEWIDIQGKDNLSRYYPSLVTNTELVNGTIQLSDKISYMGANEYTVTNKSLKISEKNITFDGVVSDGKCFTFLNFNKHLLFLNSINPVKLNLIKDNKFVNVFTFEFTIDEKYDFIGPIIPFFNRLIVLLEVAPKLYRFAIFEQKNIKLAGLSKIFKIETGIPKAIKVDNNKLSIVLNIDGEIHLASIDHVKLFTEICSTIDTDDIFTLEIKERNNIQLVLEGYTNILDKYEQYVFNQEGEDNLNTVIYNPKTRIFDINSNHVYYKEFIYLPSNLTKQDKTVDLFFHTKDTCTMFLKKCTDMGLTTGDTFEQAKYYIINHSCFEKLNSLEISAIIENNCLIISLIENSDIKSPHFKKTYTSNAHIAKLFLFNIAKNVNYIQFIFDKIIHDNQYEERLPFMEIDKTKIFDETNIYKTLLALIDSSKSTNTIKLCDKGIEIWNNLKVSSLYKQFKYDKNIEYIFKFIIDNNFKSDIGYKLEDSESNLLKTINAVNFIGDIAAIKEPYENASLYDIIIADSEDILEHIGNFASPGIIYLTHTNTLISI